MAETFKKRTLQQRRARRKQEKIERRQRRRTEEEKQTPEEMIVYIDQFGSFTDVPPSEQNRDKVKLEDIQLGAGAVEPETEFRGTISLYLTDKAYGFIREEETGQSIFFHNSSLKDQVSERDRVIYEKERTPKGYATIKVRKLG